MKLLLALFCVVAVGCSQQEQTASTQQHDATTDQAQTSELKIVSANALLTELLCHIGETSSIVATDATSMYPPAVVSLPKLGYKHAITAESILGFAPTHVVLCEGDLTNEVVESLKAAQVEVNTYEAPESIDGVSSLATVLAGDLGESVAERSTASRAVLKQQLDSCSKALNTLVAQQEQRATAVFVYSLGNGTAMCAGVGTGMDKVMNTVGLSNAFSDMPGYKPVNIESLISKSPQHVIVFNKLLKEQGGQEALAAALKTDKWKNETNIVSHDASYLATYGPRIGEALLWLHRETAE